MHEPEPSACVQIALDLICYEMHCGRLSQEMIEILEEHAADCPFCSRHIRQFKEMVRSGEYDTSGWRGHSIQ